MNTAEEGMEEDMVTVVTEADTGRILVSISKVGQNH